MESPANKKKKIAYLITILEMGGAQKYVLDLAEYMRKDDKYSVIVAAGAFNGDLFEKFKEENIPRITLQYLRRDISPLWDIFAFFELLSFLKKEKPDIVHLNSTKISILGSLAAKAAGIKTVIYTAHGWVFSEALSPIKKKLYSFAEKLTAPLKTAIIVLSKKDAELAKIYGIVPKKKLVVIPNGIDIHTEVFPRKRSVAELARITKCPPLSSAHFIIGTIANFYKNKGIDTFIEAMKILKEKKIVEKHNILFLIIGDGEGRAHLETLIRTYGLENECCMPGKLAGASKYMSVFDIFVIPSRKEGLPFVLLEAAAAHIPVIATRVGGIPEMLQSEQNGILVNPEHPKELANAIEKLIPKPDLQKKLSGALLNTVSQKYTQEAMARDTAALYRAVSE
jgi:glycosyltransferase involved in cell wall biosynthesis